MSDFRKDSIFIMLPFKLKYNNALEFAIKPAIRETAHLPTIANGEGEGRENIHRDIEDKIYNAKICIADLSKRYDDNGLIDKENVVYEIGLAHAINRHVIILCENAQKDLPYDLNIKGL